MIDVIAQKIENGYWEELIKLHRTRPSCVWVQKNGLQSRHDDIACPPRALQDAEQSCTANGACNCTLQ